MSCKYSSPKEKSFLNLALTTSTQMAKGKFVSPFRRMALTPADMNELEVVAKTIVEANMDRYLQYWDVNKRKVNPNSWKLVKSKNRMHVYSERQWKRQSPAEKPSAEIDLQSILCVGTTPGTLDDVMLGVMSPTLEVTRTKASYLDDLSGAAVLSTVKEPTSEDPFKSVAVKWMELDVRRRSMGFVKNRDYVYVEATGINYLPSGERLGYHVMHSVDIPQAHDLAERVRAKLSVCSFFRQRSDDSVSVYVMSMMDPMSDKVRRLVVPCFIKTLLSTLKYAYCGEMKKLSQALNDRYAELKHVGPPNPDHNCITCMKPMRVWRFGKLATSPTTCKLCFGYVCNSCKIEKKLSFMNADLKMTQRKVSFCSSCVSDAMGVSPSEIPKASDCWPHAAGLSRLCNQSGMWSTVLDNESSAVSHDFANTR
ncbi:hypothetical protein PPTG_16442 [Phytophthora nicotianae INRA-310]|uniref:FYVE-type domain-containing protein n=5 Tax=Phytophthora nicotianae TaxID=4792 RepID=W2PR70_PHYN3|nr:hypothetical protein PPTG_16442 [Phytophthora nicotianae INRA-310]ETI37047.1 hypothetical protein F443_16942 [Phytophthora nicotianae P1569]ETN02490.1 hypothetical protein PPTG_16442 [Phytophthora nicotianae INRA-310]KUG02290.1 hypothetical protein AM587_10004921 [Phytophthora nicotianae]